MPLVSRVPHRAGQRAHHGVGDGHRRCGLRRGRADAVGERARDPCGVPGRAHHRARRRPSGRCRHREDANQLVARGVVGLRRNGRMQQLPRRRRIELGRDPDGRPDLVHRHGRCEPPSHGVLRDHEELLRSAERYADAAVVAAADPRRSEPDRQQLPREHNVARRRELRRHPERRGTGIRSATTGRRQARPHRAARPASMWVGPSPATR